MEEFAMTIELDDVACVIQGNTIFRHINAQVDGGMMIVLTGPSGSGKTTLLGVMSLLMKPSEGDVIVNGESTLRWTDRQRRAFWKGAASFVYQDYGMIDEETVFYNLTFKHKRYNPRRNRLPERLSRLLSETGMSGRLNDSAAVLSGGEKQRVALVRALWRRSAYIFVDEPTASLDEANREIVIGLLRQAAARGACVVVSTHDAALVDMCDRKIRLDGCA